MKLPEKLAEFRRNFEAGGPPYHAPAEIHPPMHRATEELIASGLADKALKAGDKAPAFTLNDPDGNAVSSADLLAKGPLVVTFYRGLWCPYCNMDLQAIEEALPKIKDLGASLVAISPQTAPNSRRASRDNKLSFPILSDPHNSVADRFHLRFKLPDYLKELYISAFKNDLEVVNGDASWTLPMPARYVIGQDGTILYAEVNPDYTNRPDPEELLPVLEKAASVAE
jgi:peroxiredoxin